MNVVPLPAPGPVLSPPRAALRRMPDERIARWAARGSEAAFAVIFERHHQALHRYCHTIVGNGHDASDALQSTMLKAFRALPGETREIALRPWLYRIAHNESISLLRARRPDRDLTAAAQLGDPSAAGIVESRDRMRALAADLTELTEQQRGALLMRELGGLSFAEIASALQISAAAAKQTVYESRCVLQALQEGRELECDVVRRTLSDGDRRALRGKLMRGHLRACTGCHDFERALHARPAELAALAPPLPIGAAAVMLHGLVGGGGGFGAAGGLIAVLTGGAQGMAGASLATQVATIAVVGSVVAGGGATVTMPARSVSPTPLLTAPMVTPAAAAHIVAGLGRSPTSATTLTGEASPAPAAVPQTASPATAPAAGPAASATHAPPAAASVTGATPAAQPHHGAPNAAPGEATRAKTPAVKPATAATPTGPRTYAAPATPSTPATQSKPATPVGPAATHEKPAAQAKAKPAAAETGHPETNGPSGDKTPRGQAKRPSAPAEPGPPSPPPGQATRETTPAAEHSQRPAGAGAGAGRPADKPAAPGAEKAVQAKPGPASADKPPPPTAAKAKPAAPETGRPPK